MRFQLSSEVYLALLNSHFVFYFIYMDPYYGVFHSIFRYSGQVLPRSVMLLACVFPPERFPNVRDVDVSIVGTLNTPGRTVTVSG